MFDEGLDGRQPCAEIAEQMGALGTMADDKHAGLAAVQQAKRHVGQSRMEQ